jgi:transcriptional regulator with XRE-family HTH domain
VTASPLTGSRIRERRTVLGLKQAELARDVGISAAYLNLIEHNRRRIGGKLLGDIAAALSTEAAQLSEGAESALLAALRDAAAAVPPQAREAAPEADRAEEFAGRFPGWAELVARQARRISALERTVATLSDRLTHDPFLSDSMHDVLSTVTAIRSASGILADTPDIDREWRDRFHRNIYEDSQRLAESTQGLVRYLDGAGEAETVLISPQEEVEAWLEARGFHLPELERALPASPQAVLEGAGLESGAAQTLAAAYLERYRADAEAMPLRPSAPPPRRAAATRGRWPRASAPIWPRCSAAWPRCRRRRTPGGSGWWPATVRAR